MKDEFNGIPMTHFVALRPKLYVYKVDDKEVNRDKGVGGSGVRELSFADYYFFILLSIQRK